MGPTGTDESYTFRGQPLYEYCHAASLSRASTRRTWTALHFPPRVARFRRRHTWQHYAMRGRLESQSPYSAVIRGRFRLFPERTPTRAGPWPDVGLALVWRQKRKKLSRSPSRISAILINASAELGIVDARSGAMCQYSRAAEWTAFTSAGVTSKVAADAESWAPGSETMPPRAASASVTMRSLFPGHSRAISGPFLPRRAQGE